MARVQRSLSERVKAKVVCEGECLIWNGAMSGNSPVIGKRLSNGKYTNLNIRTVRGMKLFSGTTVNTRFTTTCGNPRCIAKEHIILGTAKKQVERRVRRGDTKSNMEANKKLFSLIVHTETTYLVSELNVSHSTILKMLKLNTSMYPYFLIKLKEHCNLDEVRDSDQSDTVIKLQFKLSTFALNFIRKCNEDELEKAYKQGDTYDADMEYIEFLDNCEVHNDHLVLKDGVDITPPYKCSCGYEGCVNPMHRGDE
nr:MAG TPA: hypothetical protein [Caudoviricetes sp.]